MNAKIKDIINKLADGIADEKKPLLDELQNAIEEHAQEVVASSKPKEDDARASASKYQTDKGTPQSLFMPEVPPQVPEVSSYDNLLGKPKRNR